MKAIITSVVLLLGAEIVFGASRAAIDEAYTNLEKTTNQTLQALEAAGTNKVNRFLQALAVQRLQSKLELQKLVFNLTSSLDKIKDSVTPYINLNISECTQSIADPQQFSDDLFEGLEDCLYDDKYEVGVYIINTHLSGIERAGKSHLSCIQNQIQDCPDDGQCSDEILDRIKVLQTEVPSNLNLLGVNMLNSLDGLPVRCGELVSVQYNNLITDTLLYVRTCVDAVVAGGVTPIC